MKRLLAVLGAVAMVLAAVLVRGLIDGSGDSSAEGPDAPSGDLALTCAPELLAVCNAVAAEDDRIAVTTEDEATTAERLASGDLVPDSSWAWLSAGDWPAYAEASGESLPELSAGSVLARSPAVIVARSDRAAVIEQSCGTLGWSCIGESAGEAWETVGGDPGWGRIEVGLPTPDDGEGMVSVNQAVASRVGTTDFATNDLSDPAISSWFDRIAAQSNQNATSATPLRTLLTVQGALDVVGAIEAEAVAELDGARDSDRFVVVAPEPISTADVQLRAGSEGALGAATSTLDSAGLAGALAAAGWRTPAGDGDAFEPGVGTDSIGADMRSFDQELPGDPGLPGPGVVSAVNTKWEATR